MTAETITTPSVDAIDTALAAAAGSLGEDEQRLAVAVLRLLAAGAPVSIPAGAAAAGLRLGSARLGSARESVRVCDRVGAASGSALGRRAARWSSGASGSGSPAGAR